MLLRGYPPTFIHPETTETRRQVIITLASLSTFISIVFTILVLIGSTNDSPVLSNIYFLRIDVSNIIPRFFPNALLVNSIAQTIGLRDFYQVGLWNYCEGYNGRGVTYCGPPKALYSFDPVKILLSELLAGAEIAIPGSIESALEMARNVSHVMFGFYFAGICFLAVSFVGWINCTNHAIPIIISFFAALSTTTAAVISTALFIEFRSVFENRPDLNIRGSIGMRMFIFMWMAVGFSMASFVFHTSLYNHAKRRKRGKEVKKLLDQQGFFKASRGSTIINDRSRESTAISKGEVTS